MASSAPPPQQLKDLSKSVLIPLLVAFALTCLTSPETIPASLYDYSVSCKLSDTALLPLLPGTKNSNSILFGPVTWDRILLKLLINLYDKHAS